MSVLQTTGLVGYGGHKLVVGGHLTDSAQPAPVVLYKLRDPTSRPAVAEFQTELGIWASLQNSEVVPKLVYTDASTPKLWAVGEKLFGTVRTWLRVHDKREEKVRVLASCAAALSTLHSRRLLHRDIKPSNFLYDEVKRVAKISDFGLSLFLAGSLTTGNVGTLSFKAPEVFKRQYGLPADVYSFGVCMWELLSEQSRSAALRRQFEKEKENYSSMEGFVEAELERNNACTPFTLNGEWGMEIESLIKGCTNTVQEQRPSMGDVVERLSLVYRNFSEQSEQKEGACSSSKKRRLTPPELSN
jgi:serine/threonine protein kinase